MPSLVVKDANSANQTIQTLPAVGAAAASASLPVVVASDQGALPISASALPLPAGAAQDSTITARLGTLGQKASAASAPIVVASDQSAIPVTVAANGLGALTAVPGAATNGTPLSGTPPAGKRGARLYVPPGASISFTIASAQPGSAPTTITVANPSTNTMPANWDEDLAGTQMIYVTAVTGAPLFRWY